MDSTQEFFTISSIGARFLGSGSNMRRRMGRHERGDKFVIVGGYCCTPEDGLGEAGVDEVDGFIDEAVDFDLAGVDDCTGFAMQALA
jgi:hypothetical protein